MIQILKKKIIKMFRKKYLTLDQLLGFDQYKVLN